MKRRWVINIFTFFSLLVCTATVVLWVRSYWVSDCLERDWYSGIVGTDMFSDQPHIQISSGRGRLFLLIAPDHIASLSKSRWVFYTCPDERSIEYLPVTWATRGHLPSGWSFLGLIYYDFVAAGSFLLAVPLYIITLLTLVPSLFQFWIRVRVTRRTVRRLQQKLCIQCGYDVRASKECCPECGTAIAPQLT